jgi:hypothetical protein
VTRAVTRTWYRIALARPGDARSLVAAQGEHLGVAVAAAEKHVPGAYAIAVDVAVGDGVPLGESVGKQHVVELAEVPELADAPLFRWPVGALPSLARAGQVAGVRRGFAVRPDPGLLVIEAQTDAEHLTDLFLGMLERLPVADNLEIRVQDHFEDTGTTDVWLTSRINAKKILRFLDDHDDELLGNGHLEISIYVRAHHATLKLTEHKTVVWLAQGGELATEVKGWLKELSLPAIDPLVTITDAPHYHYRPAKSRDRKKLSEMLYRERLRRVDSVPRAGARDTAG